MDATGGSAILPPTQAKFALWTDQLGYASGEQMTAYLTSDPMGDATAYTTFAYMQNIETGDRWYVSATPGDNARRADVTDLSGMPLSSTQAAPLAAREKLVLWAGSVPVPGLWQFVGEIRSADTTQVVKRAYAKFVVTQNVPLELGADGTDTEISADTTWANDRIYKIRHQVFVNPGATLTIEAGTLIQASGQNAVLVVERGARIMAEGRREAPIVMTCDAPVGLRESGCWAGLILLGNAPMTRGTGLAEGVIPETRPVYGGDDPMDSSGVLRYVRVEFAGVDFNPETQPNAFGFHGIGAGTVIDHIQGARGRGRRHRVLRRYRQLHVLRVERFQGRLARLGVRLAGGRRSSSTSIRIPTATTASRPTTTARDSTRCPARARPCTTSRWSAGWRMTPRRPRATACGSVSGRK